MPSSDRIVNNQRRGARFATDSTVADHQLDDTARLAAIVESSDDAIISTDLDGIVTSWNPGAERIYGYPAAEAIGQPNRLIIPPDRNAEEQHVREQIAGNPSSTTRACAFGRTASASTCS